MTGSVSVIVPAYNAEHSIVPCLDSILAQTYPARQILVIDDGSDDATVSVVQRYDARIRLVCHASNRGQGAARNTGIELATGDFIAFLDSDDVWKPRFLEACCQFLERHSEAIAVSTGALARYADGSVRTLTNVDGCPGQPEEGYVIEDFYAFWAQHDHIRTGSAVLRTCAVREAGFQRSDLRVSQDLEYWGYLATFGRWGFIAEPLWLGDSRAAAATPGWLSKYRRRRRLCPTVEAWQQRIVPRLTARQLPHFQVVRGRVAAGYAQAQLLGGKLREARRTVREYGPEMPATTLTRVLRIGAALGALGWGVACFIVIAREHAKGAASLLPSCLQRLVRHRWVRERVTNARSACRGGPSW